MFKFIKKQIIINEYKNIIKNGWMFSNPFNKFMLIFFKEIELLNVMLILIK